LTKDLLHFGRSKTKYKSFFFCSSSSPFIMKCKKENTTMMVIYAHIAYVLFYTTSYYIWPWMCVQFPWTVFCVYTMIKTKQNEWNFRHSNNSCYAMQWRKEILKLIAVLMTNEMIPYSDFEAKNWIFKEKWTRSR
jgi:hypothetical protein